MSSYRERRRLAPAIWTFVVLMALPPGWLPRAGATAAWNNPLIRTDALMESFRNPMISSGQYNRFLMTQSPSELLGGGADDFGDPSDYGNRWTAEPNASWLTNHGYVEWSETDLSIPGIAMDLTFNRIWRGSIDEYDGPLGQGWDFNWNKRCKGATWTGGDHYASIELYDMGRVETYTYDHFDVGAAVFVYASPPGRYDTMTFDGEIHRSDRYGISETYVADSGGWFALASITDLHDNALTFSYDAGRLTEVQNDAGYRAELHYDANGRITTIEDPDGEREWTYAYSMGGFLESVSGPSMYYAVQDETWSRQTLYSYSDGRLSAVQLPESGFYTWLWEYDDDDDGHVTRQVIGNGEVNMAYDTTNRKVTVVDRELNGTIYKYDSSNRITKREVYYTVSNSWDTTWEYDAAGEVTKVIFPRGNQVLYGYDAQGNVLEVQFKKDGSDSTPIEWSYTYTAYSRLSTLTDPNGRTWDYDYNTTGDMTKRTAPAVTVPVLSGGADPSDTNKNSSLNATNDGVIVETWAYDEWGNVTAATDAMGTVRNAQYVATGIDGNTNKKNLTKLIADPGGIQVTYQWVYDGLGHPVTFIDPTDSGGNKKTKYFWNAEDEVTSIEEPGGVTSSYFYDRNGNVISTTVTDDNVESDGLFETEMAYDRLNNITRLIMDQDASTRLTTTYAYDLNDRLTGLTEPGSQITQWTYDVRDLRTAITRKAASSSDDSITTMAYDSNGNLTAVTNPRNASYVTALAYDGYDRVTRITQPEGDYRTLAYDAASNVTNVSSYNLGNTKLAEVRYAFDEANRHYQTETLAKKADLTTDIGDGWQTRTLWRDENGNVLEVIRETDAPFASFVYDALERLIQIKDALTTDQNTEAREYDLYGNLTKVIRSDQSQDTGIEADKDVTALFVYDVRHRVVSKREQLQGGGSPVYADTTYAYSKRDQVTQVTDGAGRSTNFEYNERLWPTREWVDLAADVITDHEYDLSNRKITYKATNATTGNQFTVYEYDPLWRLIHTTWPDGEIADYTYDKAGNRVSYTDPNGTVHVAQYDKNDRLTLQDMTFTSPVVGPTQLTFAYDALDRLTEAASIEASFDVVDEWTYNTLGRPETERQIIDGYASGNGRIFGYVWDINGQKTAVTYPTSNSVVSATRDALDRPVTISLAGSPVATYTYSGPRVLRKAFPGSRATYGYDGLGRLTDILHEETTAGPGYDLAEFVYGYDKGHQATYLDKHYWNDAGGSHVTITTDTSDKGEQYAYDGAGRLVSCLRGVPSTYVSASMASNVSGSHYDDLVEYVYDQTGNRVTRKLDGATDQTCAYEVANAMTTEDGVAQSYTDNGSFSGVSNTYKYDHADRLARATDGGVTWKYHYDALGRLVQRDHTLSSVRFYYDGLHVAEQNNWTTSEGARKLFVFGPQIDELLLYVDINASPDAYYYAHTDRLGSIQLLVDASGNIEESYRYKEFGETTIVDGSFSKLTTTVNSPVGNPYRYTGRREDIQVGSYGDDWYDYRARVMRPAIGRFTAADSLQYSDGPNRYSYVGNNPIAFTDPLGLEKLLTIFVQLPGGDIDGPDFEPAFGFPPIDMGHVWVRLQDTDTGYKLTGGYYTGLTTPLRGPSVQDDSLERWQVQAVFRLSDEGFNSAARALEYFIAHPEAFNNGFGSVSQNCVHFALLIAAHANVPLAFWMLCGQSYSPKSLAESLLASGFGKSWWDIINTWLPKKDDEADDETPWYLKTGTGPDGVEDKDHCPMPADGGTIYYPGQLLPGTLVPIDCPFPANPSFPKNL